MAADRPTAPDTTLPAALASLLDRDAGAYVRSLDRRHSVLDAVLAGRRRAIIYPAARLGRHAASVLQARGVRVVAFGDGNEALWGTTVDGLPVMSPDEVSRCGDVVLVASTLHDTPITATLTERGCQVVPIAYLAMRLPEAFATRELAGAIGAVCSPAHRDGIAQAFGLMADDESQTVFVEKLRYYLTQDKGALDAIRSIEPMYFDPTVYTVRSDEVVADGGAYTGDTLQAFRRVTSDRFEGWVAFEPDQANVPALERAVGGDERVTIVAAGLARAPGTGRLERLSGFDSRIVTDDARGGEAVPLTSLDHQFAARSPSIVKLDIEGFEAEALYGARRCIEDGAVLAVSAYHSPSDLWTLPLLVAQLAPISAIYLRHYTREFDDTVCYGVPPGR
jgi:FkbM family methyltransferase